MKMQSFIVFFIAVGCCNLCFGQWQAVNNNSAIVTTTNVGIGVTNPDAKLHVGGGVRFNEWVRIGGNTDGYAWKLGVSGNVITRGGNVILGADINDRIGIGLTNPDAKLHVNGSMRVNDWMRIGGNTDGYAWKLGVSGNIITRGGNVILATNPTDLVGIGSTRIPAGFKLAVQGKIIAEDLKVLAFQNWPDYVFRKEYSLMPLWKLEQHLQQNGHLPGIPSAAQIEAEGGFDLGEMQRKMLEKIEELSLYVIQLNKQIAQLEQQNLDLQALVKHK